MGRPRDYSREGKGDWAAPAELADESGCPGAWYRTAFDDSILRYYRRRDRNGNRIDNPLLTRSTDELMIETVYTIEGSADALNCVASAAPLIFERMMMLSAPRTRLFVMENGTAPAPAAHRKRPEMLLIV